MLQSMTGYGKATYEDEKRHVSVEIRSLNSKNFDLYLKTSSAHKERELTLRNTLSKQLLRGKTELTIAVEAFEEQNANQINRIIFTDYYRQLESLLDELGHSISGESLLQSILRLPDVLRTTEPVADEDEWQVVQQTVQQATKELLAYRRQEGKSLEKDLRLRIKNIMALLEEVKQFEHQRIETIRTRLNKALDEFLNNVDIDNNRFEQELLFYLEKFDVTEEKVRLKNHCQYFTETVDAATAQAAAGKKLGFISQEIGREINTIGSKANDTDIQKLVVQMKDELEKIKEQLMNIV